MVAVCRHISHNIHAGFSQLCLNTHWVTWQTEGPRMTSQTGLFSDTCQTVPTAFRLEPADVLNAMVFSQRVHSDSDPTKGAPRNEASGHGEWSEQDTSKPSQPTEILG